MSAALEAARLGRKVALVDGLHALGGQAVNSVIGTFCGLFSNGHTGYQTHPRHRGRDPARSRRAGRALLSPRRAVEHDRRDVRRGGAGALDRGAGAPGRHHGAARRGDARRRRATGGASGRSNLRPAMATCASRPPASSMRPAMRRSPGTAGLACREAADGPIYGTQMVVIEGIDEAQQPDAARGRGAAAAEGEGLRPDARERLRLRVSRARASRWST